MDLPGCDECPGHWCEIPFVVLGDGSTLHRDDPPPALAVWPRCPASYSCAWDLGDGSPAYPLSIMRWAVSRGWHRGQRLPVGSGWLYRELLRSKGVVKQLIKARVARDYRDKHASQGHG